MIRIWHHLQEELSGMSMGSMHETSTRNMLILMWALNVINTFHKIIMGKQKSLWIIYCTCPKLGSEDVPLQTCRGLFDIGPIGYSPNQPIPVPFPPAESFHYLLCPLDLSQMNSGNHFSSLPRLEGWGIKKNVAGRHLVRPYEQQKLEVVVCRRLD
jgi:hypothetical protein